MAPRRPVSDTHGVAEGGGAHGVAQPRFGHDIDASAKQGFTASNALELLVP